MLCVFGWLTENLFDITIRRAHTLSYGKCVCTPHGCALFSSVSPFFHLILFYIDVGVSFVATLSLI